MAEMLGRTTVRTVVNSMLLAPSRRGTQKVQRQRVMGHRSHRRHWRNSQVVMKEGHDIRRKKTDTSSNRRRSVGSPKKTRKNVLGNSQGVRRLVPACCMTSQQRTLPRRDLRYVLSHNSILRAEHAIALTSTAEDHFQTGPLHQGTGIYSRHTKGV